MGNKVTEAQTCREGNTRSCLTSKISLLVDGKPRTMYTSNCDKMGLCEGLGKRYYNLLPGQCGTMPGQGAQEIYCSATTPEGGKIPDGVKCPLIQMRIVDPDAAHDGGVSAPAPVGKLSVIHHQNIAK